MEEQIGEGGMGVVYRAMDLNLERPVAMKFLAKHLLGQEESQQRFRREAKAAAGIDHINICAVYEIGEADGEVFLVMPYLKGQPLSKRIATGPLKLGEAVAIAIQIADGLQAAHDRGIVHRDIKPDNVMVLDDARSTVKIMDFGLAHLAGASKLTRQGTTMGTVEYMAPEQVTGAEIGPQTDIWSLGVVLQEMISGRTPFHRDSSQAVLYSIVNESPSKLTGTQVAVPKELERIIAKCLEKKPQQRYRRASELAADLAAMMGGPDQATRAAMPVEPLPVASKPTKHWMIGAALAGVMALLGMGWWLGRRTTEQPKSGQPRYKLTQLTRDSGYTSMPAISPSGQLIAYASDRAGSTGLDLWVQQTTGGNPIRLTDAPGDEYDASFSADNTMVAYVAAGRDAGLFVVPALGGPARRLVAGSPVFPQFSPDGKWISYWAARVEAGNRIFDEVWVAPAAGGQEKKLAGVANLRHAVWSPDSKRLLAVGSQTPYGFGLTTEWTWWVVDLDRGKAVQLDLPGLIKSSRFSAENGTIIVPQAWTGDNRIVFHAGITNTVRHLWSVGIAADGSKLIGEAEILTNGTGEDWPSVSKTGRIAFASSTFNIDIRALPLAANQGKATGPLQKVVSGLAVDTYPSVNADGSKLLYVSNRTGNTDVWLRDLKTGEEKALTSSPENEIRAVLSPNGKQVAFVRVEKRKNQIYLTDSSGASERKLIADTGNLLDWTPDGKGLIYYTTATPLRWMVLDVASGESSEVKISHPKFPIHDLRLSPDRKWAAFKLFQDARRHGPLYIAAANGLTIAPESEWIAIGDPVMNGRNWWSPDGNLLYFLSMRDGQWCVWVQRLDAKTKRPVGEPQQVFHSDEQTGWLDINRFGYGMTADKLYFPLVETRANIWLADPL
ncbi:MAG: protein kinase [Bryobacteraceae bacterium]